MKCAKEVPVSAWLMLEDSPRMLQNEMEKSLGATLIAAAELFLYCFESC